MTDGTGNDNSNHDQPGDNAPDEAATPSGWVVTKEAPERRVRPRTDDDAETYRQLLASDAVAPSSSGWVKGGALVAAVTLGGWLWRRTLKSAAPDRPADQR